MPIDYSDKLEVKPGQYYEDVSYHPCICLDCDKEYDVIIGISIIDGTYPRSCSLTHQDVRILSYEEAMHWKFYGPKDAPEFEAPWLKDGWKGSDGYIPADQFTENVIKLR